MLPDTSSTEATERALQAWFRTTLHETREAAAELLGDRPFELWPVFGMPVAEGIDALAADRGAELIVFGSPHHGPVGRVLLGNAAAAACDGRAVRRRRRPAAASATPGARPAGDRRRVRPLAGVGRGARRRRSTLARDAGATLRMIAVEPAGWSRPIRHHEPVAPALAPSRRSSPDGVEIETRLLHGDPAHTLARETERLGLLICGSRALGPLRRVMLGSVSSAVIRSAACPVVVVPAPRRASHRGGAAGRPVTQLEGVPE